MSYYAISSSWNVEGENFSSELMFHFPSHSHISGNLRAYKICGYTQEIAHISFDSRYGLFSQELKQRILDYVKNTKDLEIHEKFASFQET